MTELHVLSRYNNSSAGYIRAKERSFKRGIYLLSINGVSLLENGVLINTRKWSLLQYILFKFINYLNVIISRFLNIEFYILNSPLIDVGLISDLKVDRVIVHNTWNGFVSLKKIKSHVVSRYYYAFLHDYTIINNGLPYGIGEAGILRKVIFNYFNGSTSAITSKWLLIAPMRETANYVFENFNLKCIVLDNIIDENKINKIRPDFYLNDIKDFYKILVITNNRYKGREFTFEVISCIGKLSNKDIVFVLVGEKHYALSYNNRIKILSLQSQPHSALIALMKAVDAVMINSSYETYSMIAAEARFLNKRIFARDHLVFKSIKYDLAHYYRTPEECASILLREIES